MNEFWIWIVVPLVRGLGLIVIAVAAIGIIGAVTAEMNISPLVIGLAFAGAVIAGAILGIRAVMQGGHGA